MCGRSAIGGGGGRSASVDGDELGGVTAAEDGFEVVLAGADGTDLALAADQVVGVGLDVDAALGVRRLPERERHQLLGVHRAEAHAGLERAAAARTFSAARGAGGGALLRRL